LSGLLNRINDVQTKAKELKKGYEDLERLSKKSKTESVTSTNYQRRLLNSTMTFLRTTLGLISTRNKSETLNLKFKHLPVNLKTEILNMRN